MHCYVTGNPVVLSLFGDICRFDCSSGFNGCRMSSIHGHSTGDPVVLSLFGDYVDSIVRVDSADDGCTAFIAIRLEIQLFYLYSVITSI